MPKQIAPMAERKVESLKKPGRYSVGGVAGLCLFVSNEAARSWVLRVRVNGQRRDIGLGSYRDLSLGDAREVAQEMRKRIKLGHDPATERLEQRQERRKQSERQARTFQQVADECLAVKQAEFRNPKHAAQWRSTLEQYAYPVLGSIPVADVDVSHVKDALMPIWTTKTETATRLRGRIETVLKFATANKYRTGPNPAAWLDNLKEILPAPNRLKKKNGSKHFPALPWRDMPRLVAALQSRESISAKALLFAILTAARSGEVRSATWAEIDQQARVWRVPGERMKSGLPHTVALSDAAMRLLESLPKDTPGNLVFPSPRGRVMSDNTLGKTLKDISAADIKAGGEGFTDPKQDGRTATPHGCRSTFKDWARNAGGFADEVSELALAHVNDDATRAAYARDELLEQRRGLMADWAQFCIQGGAA